MTQYTKGPWYVTKAKHGVDGGDYQIAIVAPDREDRALIIHATVGDDRQAEGNVRLLVAARHLLEAIDQAANGSHLDTVPNHDDDGLRAVAHRVADPWAKRVLLAHADRLDAAIAMATRSDV